MILLGLDPSLTSTGWGVIRAEGNRLAHVANGSIRTRPVNHSAGPVPEGRDPARLISMPPPSLDPSGT